MNTIAQGNRITAAAADPSVWPRISLITPVWNSGQYIEQTIASVLAQEYPNLEYIVVDGDSTDGTLNVIRKYEGHLTSWISEPDRGMYDALNKGFARTTGEIMGWISATDKLMPGGLKVVGEVFRALASVDWVSGRRTALNEAGEVTRVDPVLRWSRRRFVSGANWHIQQESTYWRRRLWDRAGARVDAEWRYASDFELWLRFFRHAQLHSVDAQIGGFREHPDSDSVQGKQRYKQRCDALSEAELNLVWGKWFGRYQSMDKLIGQVPKVRAAWYKGKTLAARMMELIPGTDFPPTIEFNEGRWRLKV